MKKENIIGAVVMTALIAISLPLGVNRSFVREQDDLYGTYCYDSTGYAVYEGVENREEACANLITLARKYEKENSGLTTYIDEADYWLKASRSAYDGDNGFVDSAQFNREMGVAAEALAGELEKTKLSESDAKYPGQLLAQLKSEQDKLNRSSYNDEALEYNAKLEEFPVKYLRGIAGVNRQGIFREE